MKQFKIFFIFCMLCAGTMSGRAQTWNIGYPTESDVTATLSGNGTLTVSGTGAMADFGYAVDYYEPWKDVRNSISTVVIDFGVTSIDGAFSGCGMLTSKENRRIDNSRRSKKYFISNF